MDQDKAAKSVHGKGLSPVDEMPIMLLAHEAQLSQQLNPSAKSPAAKSPVRESPVRERQETLEEPKFAQTSSEIQQFVKTAAPPSGARPKDDSFESHRSPQNAHRKGHSYGLSSDYSGSKRESPLESVFREPLKVPDLTFSRSSIVSNISYNPAEVVNALSAPLVTTVSEIEPGQLKHTYVSESGGVEDFPDDASLSSGSIKIGGLLTSPAGHKNAAYPKISMSTAVETVVPPRLKRRPVSEIIVPSRDVSKTHQKRFSINISEDLDKLMETASNYADSPDVLMKEFASGSGSRMGSRSSSGKPSLIIPKRPTPDDLKKARNASLEHSQNSSNASLTRPTSQDRAEDLARGDRNAKGFGNVKQTEKVLRERPIEKGQNLPAATTTEWDDEFEDVEGQENLRKSHLKKSYRSTREKKTRLGRGSKVVNQLKPFSYNTLVQLLESVNGSVIGEEFSTLDLPIHEKQLIEKIVDLLSRLTLEMVLDHSRYAIGISRLEKAHKALEGFL